jgi:hypothetical protein
MTDDERAALVAHVGAVVTCEGRALSVHNSCLVLTQFPTASMVGGFRQWKAHGALPNGSILPNESPVCPTNHTQTT